VNKIYLTVIEAEVEGDTFFPEFDISEWNLASSRKRYAQVLDQSVIYRFEEWVR
jgi:dihydrofolate reductase